MHFDWLRPPGDQLPVTVRSGSVTMTANPDLAARHVQLLLLQPQDRTALQLTSATRRVGTDRRGLGVFLLT